MVPPVHQVQRDAPTPLGSVFYLVFRGIRGVKCFSGAGGGWVGDDFLGSDLGARVVARAQIEGSLNG